MKLNLDKLQFKTKHASFFGPTFTSNDTMPKNEKVQDIDNMPQLKNMEDHQCF